MFKLVSLSANKSTFHTINFKDGLNVVVGEQTVKEIGKTTNGVGKSLIIKLIDYCLGSDKNDAFSKNLSGWEFYLTINSDGKEHVIKRSIDNPNTIIFDDENLNLTKLRELLHGQLAISSDFSARDILRWFLRRNKESYNTYSKTNSREKDSGALRVLCYLLGLDYSYCTKKIKAKKEYDEAVSFYDKAFKESTFSKIMGIDSEDLELELSEINENIEKAEEELADCKYAENYSDIQAKCNSIGSKLVELNEKRFYYENRISLINEALNKEISLSLQSVEELYKSVGAVWGEKLTKSLEDVETFHESLIRNRKRELNKSLQECNESIANIDKEIGSLTSEYNELLEFLRTHVAIEKYANQLRYIDSLKNRKKELEQLENARKDTTRKIEEFKQAFATDNILAQKYLDESSNTIAVLNKAFVKLAKQFYPDKKSGLIIKNNVGENQIRFDIDARITSDGSDGISSILIFCFDLLLISLKITNFGFLYHDSLILSNVDSRQRETLFKIINKDYRSFQYIINLNSDQFDTFSGDVKKIISTNTILELSDKDEKSKLLGVEIDFGKKDY